MTSKSFQILFLVSNDPKNVDCTPHSLQAMKGRKRRAVCGTAVEARFGYFSALRVLAACQRRQNGALSPTPAPTHLHVVQFQTATWVYLQRRVRL